ncbi:MAG: aminopeptidase, partial [Bacteroidetes bacterium]|nr:aminopeptidase [Bacteroidota bacterium]
MAIYGIQQGKGQLEMVWDSRPVEDVLNDLSFPDSLKQKLRLIAEIKQFTIDSLGMNPSKNYNAVYDQKGKTSLLVVSGCEPFKFKPKEWVFPILGAVPYKGFFDKKEAKAEIDRLRADGYDVDIYSPSGWSTLGWFKDPILSNMLKRDEGDLSSLIIHELTHGTLFIKNDVDFNENLANFIGDKGAEKFLKYKFGIESKQYKNYEEGKADEKLYNEYILRSTERLDSLYKNSLSEEKFIRKKKKDKMIMQIVIGVNRLKLFDKKRYFTYSLQAFSEGNAFFMA